MSQLVLKDVTVSRGAGPVISNVDLTVEQGKVLALVGPNGAGKTSLLESVSGVIAHSGGDMFIDQDSFSKWNRLQRSRAGIAHIEQGRAIFPSLTVRENIMLTAKTEQGVKDALQPFPELEKRLDSLSVLLSGGEQQMVVLARAFASQPRFLLIDEMSLGLAPVVFTRILPVIKEIANSGVGVLLVEQFTHLALEIADEALVVSSGHVSFAQGPASVLKGNEELLKKAYLGD